MSVALSSSIAFAQTNSFDKDAVPWHKKAVMTCGMLQDMTTFHQHIMVKNLDELSIGLKALKDKYADNPPVEYANDPLWKSYFEDLADNIAIVKERVEYKKYRLVQNYCGNFCRIFGRMHKNNGITDLTDMMFSLRAEIRGTMDMYNAGNYKGAKGSLIVIRTLLKKVDEEGKAFRNRNFDAAFEPLKSAAAKWIGSIEENDSASVREHFNFFTNTFPKPYGITLQ